MSEQIKQSVTMAVNEYETAIKRLTACLGSLPETSVESYLETIAYCKDVKTALQDYLAKEPDLNG